MSIRVEDNINSRSIAIGQDANGKLKVKATVAGGGSTAPGTAYKLIFDDYGWTASTLTASTLAASTAITSTQIPYFLNCYIGIAEGVVTSKLPTGLGKSTEVFDFVIAGPTIYQSTLAAGTTGQSLYITTAAAIAASGATFKGYPWEFAVYRNAYSPYLGGYTTSPVLSTKEQYYGALSTGTQGIMLTGQLVSHA